MSGAGGLHLSAGVYIRYRKMPSCRPAQAPKKLPTLWVKLSLPEIKSGRPG